jgi:hypothetical protein
MLLASYGIYSATIHKVVFYPVEPGDKYLSSEITGRRCVRVLVRSAKTFQDNAGSYISICQVKLDSGRYRKTSAEGRAM